MPDGARSPLIVTGQEWGSLPLDTVRTLPVEAGGRDTWWHRHALFTEGAVQVALDPVLDWAQERRWSRPEGASTPLAESGFRNIRGVRYRGQIDQTLHFGGTVLEMQRLFVGPETEAVLASQAFPGMGTGKLRPAEGGLYGMDHSLADVWFDSRPRETVRVQWGLGSVGLGGGARNQLWNRQLAPAPYLLVDWNVGSGWSYSHYQSRQSGTERLPAGGAREGRYRPLGLGVRRITKQWDAERASLSATWVVVRWTDVLNRGSERSAVLDWAEAMAPWMLPMGKAPVDGSPRLAGHQGLDLRWRRPRSTWYGQLRLPPLRDARYGGVKPTWMIGHVRHGDRWTVWTEWSPLPEALPTGLDPAGGSGSLGLRPRSGWQPDWIQGAEARVGGSTLAVELGRLNDGQWTWKGRWSVPCAAADAVGASHRFSRRQQWPNRWWPALLPWAPFLEIMQESGMNTTWVSMGVASSILPTRKTF